MPESMQKRLLATLKGMSKVEARQYARQIAALHAVGSSE